MSQSPECFPLPFFLQPYALSSETRTHESVWEASDTSRIASRRSERKLCIGLCAMLSEWINVIIFRIIVPFCDVINRCRHPGSFDIVSVKDGAGHVFATRLQNIFTMGHGTRTMVGHLFEECRRQLDDRDAHLAGELWFVLRMRFCGTPQPCG